MKIAIVLGNRMRDDGSLSDIMVKRLNLALKCDQEYHPDYFIVSGGVADEVAGVSEASGMKKWLVSHGMPEEKIIMEDQSHTTRENAIFSVPIAKKYHPDTIIVITSSDHYEVQSYSVVSLFNHEINDPKIISLYYTDNLVG